MNKIFILGVLVLQSLVMYSQNLPDLFGSKPKHLLSYNVLASFPKNTWLENLVLDENANLFVTEYPKGNIYKISRDGKQELYARIAGKIAGIAVYDRNKLLVTGWEPDGTPAVFMVNEHRAVIKLLNIEGGMFPNGITKLAGGKYLIADSYAGCLWQFDAADNKITVWLKNEQLSRSSYKSEFPAANGLKIYKGNLYVSNTEKQILVKVPIFDDRPGEPVIFLDSVNIDDFVIDSVGNIYAATNVYNSVIKITPEKLISIVADLSCGVAGSTALELGNNNQGQKVLFVSTNGGMAVPPPKGVENGRIVELALN